MRKGNKKSAKGKGVVVTAADRVFVGLDVHKRQIQAAVRSDPGPDASGFPRRLQPLGRPSIPPERILGPLGAEAPRPPGRRHTVQFNHPRLRPAGYGGQAPPVRFDGPTALSLPKGRCLDCCQLRIDKEYA